MGSAFLGRRSLTKPKSATRPSTCDLGLSTLTSKTFFEACKRAALGRSLLDKLNFPSRISFPGLQGYGTVKPVEATNSGVKVFSRNGYTTKGAFAQPERLYWQHSYRLLGSDCLCDVHGLVFQNLTAQHHIEND